MPTRAAPRLIKGFPIVGVGASAGGLAAFEAFFAGFPKDKPLGMAFVVVQHLAPDHKSILTELIGKFTAMEVLEVTDGMTVKPDCVYIIAPGKDLALLNGALQLLEPAAPGASGCPSTSSFVPSRRTSTRSPSGWCCPARGAMAPSGCARSRAKAAW